MELMFWSFTALDQSKQVQPATSRKTNDCAVQTMAEGLTEMTTICFQTKEEQKHIREGKNRKKNITQRIIYLTFFSHTLKQPNYVLQLTQMSPSLS